jgi:hypothetical protein
MACTLKLLANTSCILISRLGTSFIVPVVPVVPVVGVVRILIVVIISGTLSIDTLVTNLTTLVALALEFASSIQSDLLTFFVVVTTLVHTLIT